MRTITFEDNKVALRALFARAQEEGRLLTARELIENKRFSAKRDASASNKWFIFEDVPKEETYEPRRYCCTEAGFLKRFVVPAKVLADGQGFVRAKGRRVRAILLPVECMVLSSVGLMIGEASDYLIREPAIKSSFDEKIFMDETFRIVTADTWVADYAPED